MISFFTLAIKLQEGEKFGFFMSKSLYSCDIPNLYSIGFAGESIGNIINVLRNKSKIIKRSHRSHKFKLNEYFINYFCQPPPT